MLPPAMTFNKLHSYLLFNFVCSVALLVGFSGLATGATPGEVYEKHRNEIVPGNFFIFEEHLFVVIHAETVHSIVTGRDRDEREQTQGQHRVTDNPVGPGSQAAI